VSSSLGNNFAAQSQSATGIDVGLAPDLQRQVINYPTIAAPFTVVIDTEHTYLYYVLGDGKAIRYGIGVGRDGFKWSGAEAVTRKAEWPDWTPPQEIGRPPALSAALDGRRRKQPRSAPVQSIWAIRCTGFTAPTCRRRSATMSRAVASGC